MGVLSALLGAKDLIIFLGVFAAIGFILWRTYKAGGTANELKHEKAQKEAIVEDIKDVKKVQKEVREMSEEELDKYL